MKQTPTTETFTNEQLRDIVDGAMLTQLQDKIMARELLTNREAQTQLVKIVERLNTSGYEINDGPVDSSNVSDAIEIVLGQLNDAVCMMDTAPPVPAAQTPVNFSENADADMCRKWAWEQVKELVSTDGWTLGDNINYFGFFCWGWDMRRQYNEQRPPAHQ